jgi:hypothetical protein
MKNGQPLFGYGFLSAWLPSADGCRALASNLSMQMIISRLRSIAALSTSHSLIIPYATTWVASRCLFIS